MMLTGAELLAKVKDLGDVSKTDLATACGYVSKKKDGSDRVNFTAFYEALLNAKGIELGGGSAGIGKGGRKLSYVATVQGNGNLLIGKAYTPPCLISSLVMSSRSSWGANRSASFPLVAQTKTKSDFQPAAARSSRQNSPASAAAQPCCAAAILLTKALPTMAPSAPHALT